MFSSRTEQAVQLAREIKLLADPKDNAPPPPPQPERPAPKLIMPPGVERPEPKPPPHRFEAVVAELPDDADRKVVPDIPAEDKNQPGSYERIMGLLGGMGANRQLG